MRPPSVQPKLNFWSKLYLFMLMFALGATVAARATRQELGVFEPVMLDLALIFGCASLLSAISRRIGYARALLLGLAVLTIGGAAQVSTAMNGLPFGHLTYSDEWQPVVGLPGGVDTGWTFFTPYSSVFKHSFPLFAPLLWLLVAGCAYLLAARRFSPTLAIMIAGLTSMLCNWPMDPVLSRVLSYWRWDEAGPLFGAPWADAIGWFVFGALSALMMRLNDAWEAAHAVEPTLLLGALLLYLGSLAYLEGHWAVSWANVAVFLLVVLLFPSRPGETAALVGPVD